MKFNKWTLGLAAIGVVSLASAAKADEKLSAVESALSSTTISGYIDTAAQWNFGTGNSSVAPVKFQGSGKADGFNLNVVQLTIAKPLDESEWASGYRADFWFGPDADTLNTQSIYASGGKASQGDFAIRQAYIALRTPLGNGIDWKFGVFDAIIGYESLESGNNPNYTRSYGHTIEPQTMTGVLGTYRFNDIVAMSAGVANTTGPFINERAQGPNGAADPNAPVDAESYKTYMGSIALTAPDNWGWAAGSTLYGGVVNGYNSTVIDNITSWYVGLTLATPVTGLKVGAAFDYLDAHNFPSDGNSIWVTGLYASYQATEKLSFHLRGEYLNGEGGSDGAGNSLDDLELYEVTATVQYDLWKNVISRLEFRWDHCANAPGGNETIFGGSTTSSWVGNESEDNGFPVGESSYYNAGNFNDYHSDSYSLVDDLVGGGATGGGIPTPSDHARENAFMLALNLIYKF